MFGLPDFLSPTKLMVYNNLCTPIRTIARASTTGNIPVIMFKLFLRGEMLSTPESTYATIKPSQGKD